MTGLGRKCECKEVPNEKDGWSSESGDAMRVLEVEISRLAMLNCSPSIRVVAYADALPTIAIRALRAWSNVEDEVFC